MTYTIFGFSIILLTLGGYVVVDWIMVSPSHTASQIRSWWRSKRVRSSTLFIVILGVVVVGAIFTIPDCTDEAREVDKNIRARIEAGRGPFTLVIPDHWENTPRLGFNNMYKIRYHSDPNMTCTAHIGKTLDTITVTCPNDNPLA